MRIAHIDTVYGNMCIDTVFGDRLYVSGGWVEWGFDFTCQRAWGRAWGLALAARERVC